MILVCQKFVFFARFDKILKICIDTLIWYQDNLVKIFVSLLNPARLITDPWSDNLSGSASHASASSCLSSSSALLFPFEPRLREKVRGSPFGIAFVELSAAEAVSLWMNCSNSLSNSRRSLTKFYVKSKAISWVIFGVKGEYVAFWWNFRAINK